MALIGVLIGVFLFFVLSAVWNSLEIQDELTKEYYEQDEK